MVPSMTIFCSQKGSIGSFFFFFPVFYFPMSNDWLTLDILKTFILPFSLPLHLPLPPLPSPTSLWVVAKTHVPWPVCERRPGAVRSLYHVGSGDPVQVCRLGSKHLHSLNHLVDPDLACVNTCSLPQGASMIRTWVCLTIRDLRT